VADLTAATGPTTSCSMSRVAVRHATPLASTYSYSHEPRATNVAR